MEEQFSFRLSCESRDRRSPRGTYLLLINAQLQVVLDVHPSSRPQPILLVLPRFTPLNESNS